MVASVITRVKLQYFMPVYTGYNCNHDIGYTPSKHGYAPRLAPNANSLRK